MYPRMQQIQSMGATWRLKKLAGGKDRRRIREALAARPGGRCEGERAGGARRVELAGEVEVRGLVGGL